MADINVNPQGMKRNRDIRSNRKLFRAAHKSARSMSRRDLLLKSSKLMGKVQEHRADNQTAALSKLRAYRRTIRKDVLGDRYKSLRGDRKAMRQALRKRLGAKKFTASFSTKPKGNFSPPNHQMK